MRWTRVAWTIWLAPIFLGGCHSVYHPRHDLVAEHGVASSEQEIARSIQKKAREAWYVVRSEYPRKVFSAEFRDGFIDGYTDYLDRGGDAQPPAVPPLRYTQNKKYFTPEGHVLVRDYFLGFKYGTDVAVATGQRQYLTVPVLIADKPESMSAAAPQPTQAIPPISESDRPVPLPTAPTVPVPQPLPSPKPISKLPMPKRMPNNDIKVRNVPPDPLEPEISKFAPPPRLPSSTNYADPALPTVPTLPSAPPLPAPKDGEGVTIPVIPSSGVTLPEPPDEVPSLPDDVPTPSRKAEFEFVPLPVNHTAPPPLPANHPEPMKK